MISFKNFWTLAEFCGFLQTLSIQTLLTLLDRYLCTASFDQNILTCCTGTARNIKINDISFESPINLPLFK